MAASIRSVFNFCARLTFSNKNLNFNFKNLNLSRFTACAKLHASDTSNSQTRERLNVGTIGHVDHGKTTLTSAITKVQSRKGFAKFTQYDEIDRAQEEKRRGITINATHVSYGTEKREYAHTDCPGHADYIKNMICGTSQMDGAVLVVAATDGQMPQTVEHLILARQIGVKYIVVYVNKADIVDSDVLELVEIEIRELLDDLGFDGNATPVICGSALQALRGDKTDLGEGSVIKLLDALDNYVPLPERDTISPFMMPMEGAVTIKGRGTVLIGTAVRGTLRKGDAVHIIGWDTRLKTVVTDIQKFHRSYPKCEAGDHVGTLVRNVPVASVSRGMVMCAPNSMDIRNRFEANMYLLSKSEGGRHKPLTNQYVHRFFSGNWNVACRLDVPDAQGGFLMPGDSGIVHFTLLEKMPLEVGQRFSVRQDQMTVGTGILKEFLPDVDTKNTILSRLVLPGITNKKS